MTEIWTKIVTNALIFHSVYHHFLGLTGTFIRKVAHTCITCQNFSHLLLFLMVYSMHV